ncbi:MAG: glycine--tRNA ligase subunit alpha [Gammaproteobacteria bacterium]|nr:glycine--tRNA ligase subunit alpha [Gammaproteobacteria bacterium]
MTFQDTIRELKKFWSDHGCICQEPYDMPVGAGTFHPTTFLRAIGPEHWKTAFVQPCRRPKDGRFGDNPNRLQHYFQFQVILKPSPENMQDIYIESLDLLGISQKDNDIRFVEDNWESPSLGASGVGWEVWLNGMEISQFTYFQQIGGIECSPITGEITYGLERIVMYLQSIEDIYKIKWNKDFTYEDIYLQNEKEFSMYNFDLIPTDLFTKIFDEYEKECSKLLDNNLPLPAYDYLLQNSHLLNLLDSKQAISSTERQAYILRLRKMSNLIGTKYLEIRESLGFPLIKDK